MASQPTPNRQIHAHYTSTTITVYQAYNKDIAEAAVEHQRLDASPKFSTTLMTWIKPSWAWTLYRCGYSYKDPGQERILALSLTHSAFTSLFRQAVVAMHSEDIADSGARAKREGRDKSASVRVQWDPERTVRLETLPYRSIQIGVPGAVVQEVIDGIVAIEDVTKRARVLKSVLDEQDDVDMAELTAQGLVPEERVFEVEKEPRKILKMDACAM
jgi:hypothetical protein